MTDLNLPWAYRPREDDDWGWIRDAAGGLAAIGKGDKRDKTHDQHRADKTDPYGDYAAFIVKAVNNHEALVRALENLLRFCNDGTEYELQHPSSYSPYLDAEALLAVVGNAGSGS